MGIPVFVVKLRRQISMCTLTMSENVVRKRPKHCSRSNLTSVLYRKHVDRKSWLVKQPLGRRQSNTPSSDTWLGPNRHPCHALGKSIAVHVALTWSLGSASTACGVAMASTMVHSSKKSMRTTRMRWRMMTESTILRSHDCLPMLD